MIYLIRHTSPLVAKGTCYGQTDLDITATFEQEATVVKQALPDQITHIYSSPLQRCTKLAQFVFGEKNMQYEPKLMELNCGDWEMKPWDDIPEHEIKPWMEDYVNVQIPNGESYVMLYERIVQIFEQIANTHKNETVAIVAHGGVLRSILCYITNTPLVQSFDTFKINYGAVFRLNSNDDSFSYTTLSNVPHDKERHKPSYL